MQEPSPSTSSTDQSTDTRQLDGAQAQDETILSANLQLTDEPISITPSLDNKRTFSTTPKKTVDSSSTTSPTVLLQWQQDRQNFLAAVRANLGGAATIDVEMAWQTLCQTYGKSNIIIVLEWEFLFRDLHNACQPTLVCESPGVTSDAKHTPAGLDALSREALPPVVPTQWQVIACANQAEADERTQSLSLKPSSPVTTTTLITCTLFYW